MPCAGLGAFDARDGHLHLKGPLGKSPAFDVMQGRQRNDDTKIGSSWKKSALVMKTRTKLVVPPID